MKIEGKVRWIGDVYADGLENREIHIDKKNAHGFPYEVGERVPFTLIIGEKTYTAGVRATERTSYIWICPDLTTSSQQRISLAKALHNAGFVKNQTVILDTQQDGKVRLLNKDEVPAAPDASLAPGEMETGTAFTDKQNSRGDAASTFAEENHLRDYLARNLSSIEQGLKLYQDVRGVNGIEYSTDIGRIDILAVDQNGGYVVIELKVGRGPDSVSGQILRYMGWVKRHLADSKPVRGFIIAQHVSDRIRYALADVDNVYLKEYHLRFSLSDVPLLEV